MQGRPTGDEHHPCLAVTERVDAAAAADDGPGAALVSAQCAIPCAERRHQFPLLGTIGLGLDRAFVDIDVAHERYVSVQGGTLTQLKPIGSRPGVGRARACLSCLHLARIMGLCLRNYWFRAP